MTDIGPYLLSLRDTVSWKRRWRVACRKQGADEIPEDELVRRFASVVFTRLKKINEGTDQGLAANPGPSIADLENVRKMSR